LLVLTQRLVPSLTAGQGLAGPEVDTT
jgi:hypothetical protein